MELLGKNDFLKKYNINRDKFDQADIAWNDLVNIFNDYKCLVNDLESIAQFMSQVLNKAPRAHSTKHRIKNPEHLIEKIIRKRIEKNLEISLSDYREKVTDIIGVRVLHLFKEDWLEIDEFIKDKFEVIEGPRAHIGMGDDDTSFINNKCTVVRHNLGYRSVHYLVKSGLSKQQFIAEIQVRTIFEEGWSEIDHELKYPYVRDNLVLERLLHILNRFAASADEMGSFINYLQVEFGKSQQVADELMNKINNLDISNIEKGTIKGGIDKIGNLFLAEPKRAELKTEATAGVVKQENVLEAEKGIGCPEPLSSVSPTPKIEPSEPIKNEPVSTANPIPEKMESLDMAKSEDEIGYDYKNILEQRRAMEGQNKKGRTDFVSIMDILNHNKKSPSA